MDRICFRLTAFCFAFLAMVNCAGANDGIDGVDAEELTTKFIESLRQNESLEPAVRDKAIQSVVAGDASTITTALEVLHPEYSQAISEVDLEKALDSLTRFTTASDPFLSADAIYFLSRTLMSSERFEQAQPLLDQLANDLAPYSAHRDEVQFFRATCLAGTLKMEEAAGAFADFLEQFPYASERLRVAAWQQIQTIQAVRGQKLAPITSRMEYSRRRLDIAETGEATQTEQKEIVRLLSQLIQEEQKKECSGGSCNKSGAQKKNEQSASKDRKSPTDPSKSQKGGMSNVANGEFVERAFDNGEASPWSRLRDRSRDPANTAMKEKLPPRYREFVERYNDVVSGNETKKDQ